MALSLGESVDARVPWVRALHDLDAARSIRSPGPKLRALRHAGEALGDSLRQGPRVSAVRTLPQTTLLYPTAYAFNHTVPLPVPYVVMSHRCLLVQVRVTVAGQSVLKNVLFNPSDIQAAKATPYFAQLLAKTGERFADAITTVSPRYAREILTPQQGCRLDGVLRSRAERVSGILNGVDYALWNPETDPLIAARFSAGQMAGKAQAKSALQRQLGLEVRHDALIFGVVSRLSEQKGLHLLPDVIDELVAHGGQLAVLGSGDANLEAALHLALARHPSQAVLRTGYDEALAHRIMAGADVLLVPSRFEPCGLTQLYAMRYGTLPLVHGVGGLADTVVDAGAVTLADGSACGFVFQAFSAEALRQTLLRAFDLYRHPAKWAGVQRHAMALRFDWHDAALAYRNLFERLLEQGQPA